MSNEVVNRLDKLEKGQQKLEKGQQKLEKGQQKLVIEVISIKAELKNCVTKDEYRKGKNEILDAIDGLTKEVKTSKEERTANLGAHDRIQNDINEVRGHVGLNIKNSVLGT